MRSENIPPRYHPSQKEAREIAPHLGYHIDPPSIVKATLDWVSDESIIRRRENGGITVYPHLRAVLAIFRSKPRYYVEDSGVLRSDLSTYCLAEAIYEQGLLNPVPDCHRLTRFLDWLHFPANVKGATGVHFEELWDLWELMCMNGDTTLYRHSLSTFELLAPLWEDVHLTLKTGVSLIKQTLIYGDYKAGSSILTFLTSKLPMVDDNRERDYLFDVLGTLDAQLKSSIQPRAFSANIASYSKIYRRAATQLARLGQAEQPRQLRLMFSISVAACRYAVEHVAWCRQRYGQPNRGTLDQCALLLDELSKDGREALWTSIEYDTVARCKAFFEGFRTDLTITARREIIDRAVVYSQKANEMLAKELDQKRHAVENTLIIPKLKPWVSRVQPFRIKFGLQANHDVHLTRMILTIAKLPTYSNRGLMVEAYEMAQHQLFELEEEVGNHALNPSLAFAKLLESVAIAWSHLPLERPMQPTE